MNLLLAAISVLVLALAGVGLLRFLWPPSRDVPGSARLALGYCVGCWFVTMIFFGAYLAGVSFSRWLIIAPVVVLAGVGVWRGRSGAPTMGLILPVALCLLTLALSWGRPVYGYDAVMMWALKAKMMFFAKTWPATMFDPFTTAHTEYPPLIPSAQAFVFFWLGEFDDVASRIIFAAFFASGAAILWWWLGQWSVKHRWVWVVWWCALPVMLEQVKITYADLPLAVYLLVFYGATVSWLREPARRDWLWLAGIFGGLAFWVKQDAMIGVGAGLAALLVYRRLAWRPVLLLAGLAVPWRVFVWVRNLPSDFALRLDDVPVRTAQVVAAQSRYAFVEGGYAFFWWVFLVALVLGWRRLRVPEMSWLVVAWLVGVVGVVVVYWFSTPDLSALLQTSLERVLLNLFVPALLLVALLGYERLAVRWVVVVATVGLGLFEIYGQTRECLQLRREFGGKTLTEQRVSAVEPALRQQIARAFKQYPPGTHVQVWPKRSLWRHRFYYETYPYLIVDSTATNVIRLATE